MKNLIILCLAFILPTFSMSQNEQYTKAMTANLAKMKTVEPQEGWNQIANTYDRIANAEKDQWLPYYYSAYCNMIIAATSEDQTSKEAQNHLDKAQNALDKAMEIEKKNSEIYALQGFIYTGRIWKSPMVNGARYSPKAHAAYDKAIALDATNSRPYYLKGQLIFHSPSFFGGGKDNAKASLLKAQEKYNTFTPKSELHPNKWGMSQNNNLLKKCGVLITEN